MKQLKIAKQITNRENESLDRYLNEIAQVDMISAEEEVDLSVRIQAGDQIALEKLTKANLRFVVSVAKQYQHKGVSLVDLINEGNVGLIKAASKFDATRGFKFISYAVWWIRQAIMQALSEQPRIVRLPMNRVSLLTQVIRANSMLEQKLERTPTNEELAEELDISTDEVTRTLSVSHRHTSVDQPSSEEGNNLLDVLENESEKTPDSAMMVDSLRMEVKRALATLSEREAEILILYFGLNGHPSKTLAEIGDRFDLTRERVRQIKDKATRRLQQNSSHTALKSYLG